MKMCRTLIAVMLLTLIAVVVTAQTTGRRVTPNTTGATATQPVNERRGIIDPADSLARRPAGVVHAHDSEGRTFYVDTITGREWVDSAALPVAPRMQQPLLYSVSVGVNLWDPVMRIFGQKYGLIDFVGELNLHNRYIPVFEAGLGKASVTPDDANYTYSSPVAPYFKIGCNYNFLYNSNPRYMAYAGARYGWTSFKYKLTDITHDNGYWGTESSFDIPSQTASVGYFELLFGIRVGIAANVSVGWTFKYHGVLHGSKEHKYGDPWYIPGYGTRGSSVTGAFTVTYTLPLARRKPGAGMTELTDTEP